MVVALHIQLLYFPKIPLLSPPKTSVTSGACVDWHSSCCTGIRKVISAENINQIYLECTTKVIPGGFLQGDWVFLNMSKGLLYKPLVQTVHMDDKSTQQTKQIGTNQSLSTNLKSKSPVPLAALDIYKSGDYTELRQTLKQVLLLPLTISILFDSGNFL